MLSSVPLAVVPWAQWCKVSYGPDSVVETLSTPVVNVVITMEENFDTCRGSEECEQRMREVQSLYAQEFSCANIPYNFMIGNDGNVYEGRGWQEKPLKSRNYEDLQDRTIDIAIIGNEKQHQEEALDVLHRFVKECIEIRIIHEPYTVRSFRGEKRLF